MGGITSSAKKKEMEREAELKKMTAARLAIFNKPPEPEDSSDEDSVYNSDRKDVKQLSLTENNVKVNSRKIKAPPEDAPATAVQAAKLDGPSYILDDRMIKVIEFMLDPEFDKGPLTLRTLLTTTEKKSSSAFSKAVEGIAGILVVIESRLGHVFGAYIDDKFELTNGGWRKGSDNNFLFALGNISKKPMKLLANPDRKYSFYSDSTKGFYAGQGKFDISAFSARYVCMNPVVYNIMAPSYNPKNDIELEDGALCGTPGIPNYEPKRMEVFAVTHFEDPNDPATKKKEKERAKIAAQKIIDKEKRAKQRRLERKMKKEKKKRAYARSEAARNEGNDDNPYKSFVPETSTHN